MAHVLGLTIDETISSSTLRICDSSVYQVNQPVQNCILEITPPNKDCPIIFNVSKFFTLILNVSNLELLQTSNIEDYNLPDGVYEIKYSINPNSKIFKETVYFRTYKIEELYRLKIIELFNDINSITKSLFQKRQEQLIEIQFLIKAAKSFAELEEDYDKASTLYNEAMYLLKEINYCSKC